MKRKLAVLLALGLCVFTLLTGCGGSGGGEEKVVKIATKPMTEGLILGEMLSQLITADTDLTVEMTKGVGGGTSNIHPAIVKGDFDMYPEYTGTAWYDVLKKTDSPDEDTLYEELKQAYAEEYQLEWTGLYGFNNTYTLAVRKDKAEGITTMSQLAPKTPELNFGANPDYYEREDGFNALTKTYGYNFKNHVDMDMGLKYTALESGEVDVINAFTTDGQLSTAEAVTLEDDKHFFKNYYSGTVVRQDCLEKYPELREVLAKMDGLISEKDMQKLNHAVEIDGKDEVTVAGDFLKEKGLLK